MGAVRNKPVVRVVVVEDDPTLLTFWGRILSDLGVKDYELFSDPTEALLMLEETPIDVMISDVIMQGINGYELARIARRRNPHANIVLTTAYGANLSHFDLAGCRFHLLHKPYTDISSLKRFIDHIVQGDTSFDDISEDSSSENEDYPEVTEWKL